MRHYFANKGPSSQGYGFSSGYVWMWDLDCEETWAPKNWCFWTMVLEKTLESPLDYKDIQPVNPEGNKSRIFSGRPDADALILWPSDAKSQLIRKVPDSGKSWMQEEKGMTEDEVVGWHHRLDQWTWAWANSGRWWRIGKSGMLQSMWSQRVRHDWMTELNWTNISIKLEK